jgi:hypothetical protein
LTFPLLIVSVAMPSCVVYSTTSFMPDPPKSLPACPRR